MSLKDKINYALDHASDNAIRWDDWGAFSHSNMTSDEYLKWQPLMGREHHKWEPFPSLEEFSKRDDVMGTEKFFYVMRWLLFQRGQTIKVWFATRNWKPDPFWNKRRGWK